MKIQFKDPELALATLSQLIIKIYSQQEVVVYFYSATSVADLHSKILDAPHPLRGPKFFQFHAVFGNFWQNRMLAPPWGVGAPT